MSKDFANRGNCTPKDTSKSIRSCIWELYSVDVEIILKRLKGQVQASGAGGTMGIKPKV